MTLDTRVYALTTIDHCKVFSFCRDLLGATGRHTWRDEDSSKWYGDGVRSIGNHLGQGLPALLDIKYRAKAPLRTPEQAAEHDEDICNLPGKSWYDAEAGPCDGDHPWQRPCWLEVSFDTAYGYRDDRGYGCGDLHAEYVFRLGKWFDVHGVRWEWQNEFTGEVHGGDDRYPRLIDLTSGGFEASAWFRTTVLPAITRGALGGESA